MLRVRLRGRSIGTVVVGSGEVVAVGRAPEPGDSPESDLQTTVVALPDAAHHVSRTAFQVQVGAEVVRLRYLGQGEAQLSSLFDAPAGARRVTLVGGMTALLDEGDNQLVLLRGAVGPRGAFADLALDIEVTQVADADGPEPTPVSPMASSADGPDGAATTAAPTLERFGREWFVALALAEPWLVGQDDYPRPPSNREIFERVTQWNHYAWNLARPQRVDDSIKIISRLAFGPADDPFAASTGRSQNIRFAVGRRAAEVRLVTPDDLAEANRRSSGRAPH